MSWALMKQLRETRGVLLGQLRVLQVGNNVVS
jgi:hypothetical protein